MPTTWDDTEKMVKRAEAAGCPVLAWTIDLLAGRNTETATRFTRADQRDCVSCHSDLPNGRRQHADATRQADVRRVSRANMNPPGATWSYVERLKKMTKMKLVLKGIDTAEDAQARARTTAPMA